MKVLSTGNILSVFFNLEKAYDTTWRYGILRDLHILGLRGNLPLFVQNFLSSRSFQVRLGSMLSATFIQQNGVPQGTVLSCTLFLVKIDAILQQLPPSVLGGLNVDDLHISCRSPRLFFIEHQLNRAILRPWSWADQNGFHFSSSKTVGVHFSCLRGLFPMPALSLYQQPIPFQTKAHFLGLVFDSKLFHPSY